ncbi:nucleoside deaminase [Brevibacillus formosus]|uniref:nucleoside deaminase n=1 Tax=Brevibacillus formosus TaxID=54913 RepID=UPI003F1990CF
MDYMKLAVEKTMEGMNNKLGGPFGAAVVKGDEIIAVCSNRMMADMDPSQHAEMVAIREACKTLGTMDLTGCEIYATCEPCPMCVGAIIWSGIKVVHYCSTAEDAHENGFSDKHLRDYFSAKDQSVLNMIKVEKREDCDQLFTHYHKLNEA